MPKVVSITEKKMAKEIEHWLEDLVTILYSFQDMIESQQCQIQELQRQVRWDKE